MDWRNNKYGYPIPVSGYSDQPYAVKTEDGAWLLTVTTGSGAEGASGQHVVSVRSKDHGKTWEEVRDVSPADAPESSYSVLYKTDYGRVYCFYNYNADDLRAVRAENPPFRDGLCRRVDTQGHFVFRYTDDGGRSWSNKWYDVPMRRFAVDRMNPYGGELLFFWNVGKPFSYAGGAYVPIYKIRCFGEGFMRYSEGALLHCANINTERDPEKLVWETLPDREEGIHCPREQSIISEEHSYAVLSDGSIFCVFRTTAGHPYCTYSRDGAHTFSAPEPLTYSNGRPVKHPRAANFIWKCENGKYLYWFHNHGGNGYDDRNPAWLCGAVEYPAEDGLRLAFSQPLPVLYDDDPVIRMSYPDLVEDGGEYYLTETQKNLARVHPLDRAFVESLWTQPEFRMPGTEPRDIPIKDRMVPLKPFTVSDYTMPDGRSKSTEYCFTLRFSLDCAQPSQTLFSTVQTDRGIRIVWDAEEKCLTLYMSDGQNSACFSCDDILLSGPGVHRIACAFDGGARCVYFSVDGIFCDGGKKRQFGFGRFSPYFRSAAGSDVPGVNRLPDMVFREGISLY